MSVDLRGSHSLPYYDEVANSGDLSPMPEVHGPEENYRCSQVAAEMLRKEIASPRPSSVDPPLQDSPDSSTRPKLKLTGPESEEDVEKGDNKVHTKKQKMRTVFSQAQLCALRDRFQRQRYLNLQQMQELSAILNLSYKQVKTWFQNQRMKCKQWQKNQWLKTSNGVTQKGSAFVAYPSLHSSYPQGCLNTSGSLSMWDSQTLTSAWSYQTGTNPTCSNQTWTNSTCSNQALTNPSWSNQVWNTQSLYSQAQSSQAWNTPFHNFGDDSLQPYMQYQQNFSASNVEASLEATGKSHMYFSTPQGLELLLNYSEYSEGGWG
ncbi:LOW QUALITY PROTEIN: homeobox protein NANOG-like [Peromyscus californicus insignis]|uniref:LOW QUALITY PROTEIN: homeobox protein NANOG-like n=1 Tax=Peromyscus californicus insignis TaxID=564181 RepID=UPI0022A73F3B|nr:LOW QUALITY PROTEIN: homeobox protein NANOG-like [Peromyscus californicus insignis]